MKVLSILFYFLFPIYGHQYEKSLFCNLCNYYNIDMNNPNWYHWFEYECFDIKKREHNVERRETCYYYDYQLDIHYEDFWDRWVACNCVSKEINSFREEL